MVFFSGLQYQTMNVPISSSACLKNIGSHKCVWGFKGVDPGSEGWGGTSGLKKGQLTYSTELEWKIVPHPCTMGHHSK